MDHRGVALVRVAMALAISLGVLLVGACTPVSVTFTLGDRGRLQEATVYRDQGSPQAKIAVIDAAGVITEGGGGLMGRGSSSVHEMVRRLELARKDPDVKGVVVRINSPGGSVSASDTIYREIRAFRDETGKPVVASFGEVAASGGYYIALAADEIVTEPTSITGSIGVIIPIMNFSEGLGRIGVHSRAITSGPNKDLGNPMAPPRPSQELILQGIVDDMALRFHTLVRARRPAVDPALFGQLTDGRVVTGERAVEAGLADREGGLREAFGRAKELAGVSRARLVKYQARSDSTSAPSLYAASESGLTIHLDADVMGEPRAYYLWSPGLAGAGW